MSGRDWSADDDALLARYADQGLSARTAARALRPPVTRNAVIGRANRIGVKFHAPPVVGGGCNHDQALKGWETRRARQAGAA